MVKRGRYIAAEPRLQRQIRRAHRGQAAPHPAPAGGLSASGDPAAAGPDRTPRTWWGPSIRDAKGVVLASQFAVPGDTIRNLPPLPAARIEEVDTVTERGEEVILFRAPVSIAAAGGRRHGGGARHGRSGGGPRAAEEHQGRGGGRPQQGRHAAGAGQDILPDPLHERGPVPGARPSSGWFLVGTLGVPRPADGGDGSAVTKGDLTEKLAVDTDDELGQLSAQLQRDGGATCGASWTTSRRRPCRWPPRRARSPPTRS